MLVSYDNKETPVIRSAPELLARAMGVSCAGPQRCYLCGAPCGMTHTREKFIRDTFTGGATVAYPASRFICEGCVLCLRESCEVPQCDGTNRHINKGAMRMCSWLLTATSATAATKAHTSWIREMALAEHAAPWCLSIAISGQKHLLYRGVVNYDAGPVRAVTLEGERIDYYVQDLRDMLATATAIVAACGKPSLEDGPTPATVIRMLEYLPRSGEKIVQRWQAYLQSQASQWSLACFLSPAKKEASRVVSPE